MPNECFYQMKVVGKQANIKKLVEIMNRDYNYSDEEKAKNQLPHLWRVFSADDHFYPDQENVICGYCAWSVYTCMFDGAGTYQGDHKNDPKYKGTTIVALSKELGLKIEIYSEEYGMCFQEHYVIDNGEVLIDECEKAEEEWDEKAEEPTGNILGGFVDYGCFAI